MALVATRAGRLKPDLRLAQAVSEFEAGLTTEQKASFRNARSGAHATPPSLGDVMRLTAEIDARASRTLGGGRCFGPRMTNVLEAAQQFAALGDVVVGGSQNLIACGVWAAVRMALHTATAFGSYLEKLSLLFMAVGRNAPRYQAMAVIYPRSKALRDHLCEYYIIIIQLCRKIQEFSQKSTIRQMTSSLSDSELKTFQSDLDLWSASIREEVMLQISLTVEQEASENSNFRSWFTVGTKIADHSRQQKNRLKWLDACSTYDYQTTWKQTLKRGGTSWLSTWQLYQYWRTTVNPDTMVCRAKLGAGKSVLLANIVNDLSLQPDVVVTYFFCRHDVPDSLLARTIFGSLARHLLHLHLQGDELDFIFKENVPQLDVDTLVDLLIRAAPSGKTRYIVLDGLDEVSPQELESILLPIQRLQKSKAWHICISLRLAAQDKLQARLHYDYESSVLDENPDIADFIATELQTRRQTGRLVVRDESIISEIQNALVEGAGGMFLWVALMLDSICSEPSDYNIRESLKMLPKTLDETFARILAKSSQHDTKSLHVRIFKFLVAAVEPLTVDQIGEALSVIIGDTVYRPERCLNSVHPILGYCGSLVMVDEEEDTVRLVHHSARNFCLGNMGDKPGWQFAVEEAHQELGETLMTYLHYGVFDTKVSTYVAPKIHVGAIPQEVIRKSLGPSNYATDLVLSLMSVRHSRRRDIRQTWAEASQARQAPSAREDHTLVLYARKYWPEHTKYTWNMSFNPLWYNLYENPSYMPDKSPELPGQYSTTRPFRPQPEDDSRILRFMSRHRQMTLFRQQVHVRLFSIHKPRRADRIKDIIRHGQVPVLRYLLHGRRPSIRWVVSMRFILQQLDPFDLEKLESHMVDYLTTMAIALRLKKLGAQLCALHAQDRSKSFHRRLIRAAVCGEDFSLVTSLLSQESSGYPQPYYQNRPLPPGVLKSTPVLLEMALAGSDPSMLRLLISRGMDQDRKASLAALRRGLFGDMSTEMLLGLTEETIDILPGRDSDWFTSREIGSLLHIITYRAENEHKFSEFAIRSLIYRCLSLASNYPLFLERACMNANLCLATLLIDCGAEISPSCFGLALSTWSKPRYAIVGKLLETGAKVPEDFLVRTAKLAIQTRHWDLAKNMISRLSAKGSSNLRAWHDEVNILHQLLQGEDFDPVGIKLLLGQPGEPDSAGRRHGAGLPSAIALCSQLLVNAESYVPKLFSEKKSHHQRKPCYRCLRRNLQPEHRKDIGVSILQEELAYYFEVLQCTAYLIWHASFLPQAVDGDSDDLLPIMRTLPIMYPVLRTYGLVHTPFRQSEIVPEPTALNRLVNMPLILQAAFLGPQYHSVIRRLVHEGQEFESVLEYVSGAKSDFSILCHPEHPESLCPAVVISSLDAAGCGAGTVQRIETKLMPNVEVVTLYA